MKKFYAFAFAACAALSMNATLYVVGSGDGLTWDLPGMAVEGSGNVYTFTIKNLSKFKASLNNTTEWDGDGGFNAGCYGTGTATFAASQVYPDGQTLPMEPWGEDQEVPYTGDYTITMDFNAMTMTVKSSTMPANKPADVFLRGTMNDWGSPADYQFTLDSFEDADHGVFSFWCEGSTAIPAGVEFKIADANWGSINFGADGMIEADPYEATVLVYNGGNISLDNDFEGKITFYLEGFHAGSALFDSEAGVKNVDVDNNLPVEYFNLQGVRVENPENGLFIARQGNKVTKVVK